MALYDPESQMEHSPPEATTAADDDSRGHRMRHPTWWALAAVVDLFVAVDSLLGGDLVYAASMGVLAAIFFLEFDRDPRYTVRPWRYERDRE